MHKNKLFIILLIFMGLFIGFLIFKNTKGNTDGDTYNVLNSRIQELEIENQSIKEHYKAEYEARNTLDIKARKIYQAIVDKDVIAIEREVSKGTQVFSNKIIFNTGKEDFTYNFSDQQEIPVLRQRYYMLSPDKMSFTTGYEMTTKNIESIPVIVMIFRYENEDWKLSNIQTE